MWIKILLVIAIAVQAVASVYALRLVYTTKYNAVWILFIAGFLLLSIERVIAVHAGERPRRAGHRVRLHGRGGVVLPLGGGDVCAQTLQVHRAAQPPASALQQAHPHGRAAREEKSRSRFSKELHDGLGPLLSSAKMSLSALAREQHDDAQRELIDNTTYVIDEAIRSLREISNNLSPHVLNDFGLARGVQHFVSRSAAMHRGEDPLHHQPGNRALRLRTWR